jgi:hypothetical protein
VIPALLLLGEAIASPTCPTTHPLAAWDDYRHVFVGQVIRASERRWIIRVTEPLSSAATQFLPAGKRISVRVAGDGPPPIAQQVDTLNGATGLFYLNKFRRPWFGFCNPSFSTRFPYRGRDDFADLDHGVALVADLYRRLPTDLEEEMRRLRAPPDERPWAYLGIEGFPWPMNQDPARSR